MKHAPRALNLRDAREVCDLIETAENRAMACDGPVPDTTTMLDRGQLERLARLAWRLARRVIRSPR